MDVCNDCGSEFAEYFVTDEVWLSIVGSAAGCICLNCLHKRALKKQLAPSAWAVNPLEWRGNLSTEQEAFNQRADIESDRDRLVANIKQIMRELENIIKT